MKPTSTDQLATLGPPGVLDITESVMGHEPAATTAEPSGMLPQPTDVMTWLCGLLFVAFIARRKASWNAG